LRTGVRGDCSENLATGKSVRVLQLVGYCFRLMFSGFDVWMALQCQEKHHPCLNANTAYHAFPKANTGVRHRKVITGFRENPIVKGSKINWCAFVSLSSEEKGT
jgi:hypothetical protein